MANGKKKKNDQLTAAEIMSKDVFALESTTLIPRAIAALRARSMSGAPVVDRAGRCIGVFSLADLARRDVAAARPARPREPYFGFDPFAECVDLPDDAYVGLAPGRRDTVGAWMTRGVRAVRPGTSVRAVCRRMLDERIHRVFVADRRTLRGVVSTLDVVRLMAGRRRPPEKARARAPRGSAGRASRPGR